MKKQLLSGIAALMLLFLIPSCQQEEVESPAFKEVLVKTTLADEGLLATSLSDFTSLNLNARTETATTNFGTLDFNGIVKRIVSEDQPRPNYTIPLTPPDSVGNSMEYMVLIGMEEGYRGYILQYQTDYKNTVTLFNKSAFTGHVRILGFDRNIMADNLFENGRDLGSYSNGRTETAYGNCNCDYTGGQGVEGPDGADPLNGVTNPVDITCTCTLLQGEPGGGGGGGDGGFPPGGPIGFPGGGGFGGGGSGGGGNPGGEPGGIPVGGSPDPIGVIDLELPADIAAILTDDTFTGAVNEALNNPLIAHHLFIFLNAPDDVKRRWYQIFQQFGIEVLKAVITGEVSSLFDEQQTLDAIHIALDLAGLVPILGELADGTNAILYVAEGDYLNAGFSAVAVVPIGGDAVGKGVKYVLKTVDATSPVAGRIRTLLKNSSLTTFKTILKKIHGLPTAKLKAFFADLVKKPALIEAILQNPNLVDIWKKTSDFISPTKTWIRTQVPLLEKLSNSPADVQDRVLNYYKRHNSNVDINKYPGTSITGQKYDDFGHPDFTKDVPITADGSRAVYKPANGIKGTNADLTDASNWALKPKNQGGGGYNPGNFQKIPNSTKVKIKNDQGVWVECTWHHHQDGKTLIPVPSAVHSRGRAAHIGGVQAKRENIVGFFDSPVFI